MSQILGTLAYSADGWGPSGRDDSEIPCQAFKKDERFGRPIEWWGGAGPRLSYRNYSQTFGNAKDFDEDTSGFTFVDSGKQQMRVGFRRPVNRGRGGRGRGMDRGYGGRGRYQMQQRQAKFEKNRNRDKQTQRRTFVHRAASVEVKPNWKVIHQFVLADLAKLECQPPSQVSDIKILGHLETYDSAYDKVNQKQPPKLEKCDQKSFYSVTSTMDPVIREISNEVWEESQVEDAPRNHHIFATDTILATIMSCARSVNSWDLSIDLMDMNGTKIMFIDKREDYETHPVNETSREAPTGEQMQELAEELALVNQQFSQQILKKPAKIVKPQGTQGKNPFPEEGEDAASVLYKYRKWKLTNDITLIARCSLDGVAKAAGKDVLYKAYSLLEYDGKATNWRQKLETSAGAVLATEIKNNACLVAKWTAQAVLSGADQMKIGFVGRTTPSGRLDHQVLGCQSVNPLDFALNNIALHPRQMWALLRSIVEHCIKVPDGRYVVMRDPNKGVLFLYSLPPEENEDDEEQQGENDTLGQNVMTQGTEAGEAPI